ncbi:MAG TPA: protein-disulfide reductase DsbD domain-containing protein, partial [Chthoniobacterales bacterium]|nr:protein-disulfide reductase DsbD domain-containing protein [Chthoniobacterales bacterium]
MVLIRMSTGRALTVAFVALMLAAVAPAPSVDAQTYQGRELVTAELVADTTSIQPGNPFTVGVLMRMAPHWHTYWKFPGDAGIATEIKWKLPPDWKVGEIQWPTPLRLVEPGDIHVYGYHGEVLLMQEITPPASLPPGPVKLAAEANWLVCEKICIPGSATVELDVPSGGSAAAANEELFAQYRRALPQPWPADDVAAATWT